MVQTLNFKLIKSYESSVFSEFSNSKQASFILPLTMSTKAFELYPYPEAKVGIFATDSDSVPDLQQNHNRFRVCEFISGLQTSWSN